VKKVNQHINKARIRFSHWSRKNWAVFNSLGREVSIGHIDVPVAGQALRKSELKGSVLAESSTTDNSETDSVEEATSIISSMAELMLLMLSAVITLELPSPSGKSSTYNISQDNWLTTGYHLINTALLFKWPEFVLSKIKQL